MSEKRSRILELAELLERQPIGLGRWLLVLGSIIVVRHFLEQLSGLQKTLYFLSYFIHYPLAYVAPLLALAVLLAALSGERIERVTRLMLFAWFLTLLPPLVDLAVAQASETRELIGYLIPRSASLGEAFLNLFNPAFDRFQGTTAGIRIEAAVGCVLGAFYVFLKRRSVPRAVAAFFGVYVTMFFFFALPPITLALCQALGADVENVYVLFFAQASVHRAFANATPFAVSDLSNSLIDLLVLVPLTGIWYRMYDRGRFAALCRTMDPARLGFHVALTVSGVVLAGRLLMASRDIPTVVHPLDVVAIVGLLAASFFTAWTVGTMKVALARADAVGVSPERREVELTTAFLFSFACLFALSVSYVSLTYVLTTIGVSYLMYAPPLRLSRVPLVSGLLIGAAGLFSFGLGYAAYAGGSASLWVPRGVVTLCLVVPALALVGRGDWVARPEEQDRWSLRRTLGVRRASAVSAGGVLAASFIPAAALRDPRFLIPGALVGGVGALVVARASGSRIRAALGGLAAVFTVVLGLMGGAGAPAFVRELESTGFARATRKAGTFELTPAGATAEDPLMSEGLSLFARGDYVGAADAFRRVVEDDPENVRATVSVGSAYMRLGRFMEAARAFRRALDLEPDNVHARVGLGQTYKLQGDIENAVAELNRALEVDPGNADATYTFAIIYGEAGDIERELDALRRTVALDPKNSVAQSRLADILMSRGSYDEAIVALRAALGGRMPVEYVRTRLADAYYSMGNIAAAENELRKDIAERPKSASTRAVLARLLAGEGRKDEAIHELEQAIALTSDAVLRARFEEELSALRR